MEAGQTVYKCIVSPVLTGFGLHVREMSGKLQPITDGWAIVHEGGCSYEPTHWHATPEDAKAVAADEIDRLIGPAVAQVAKLRQEAGR